NTSFLESRVNPYLTIESVLARRRFGVAICFSRRLYAAREIIPASAWVDVHTWRGSDGCHDGDARLGARRQRGDQRARDGCLGSRVTGRAGGTPAACGLR